jgi:hypothetical protein
MQESTWLRISRHDVNEEDTLNSVYDKVDTYIDIVNFILFARESAKSKPIKA